MSRSQIQSKFTKYPWLILLLFVLALFLPLLGELVQRVLIGDEQVCCMPDNYDFWAIRAGIARHLRLFSILIIGGSIVGGIALTIYALRKAQHVLLPHLPQRYRMIVRVVLIIIAVYIIAILLTMLLFFVLRNDLYFYERPYPGGSLYDDAWYSPIHWWRATFNNPFA